MSGYGARWSLEHGAAWNLAPLPTSHNRSQPNRRGRLWSPAVKTLHTAYRVSERERSMDFYRKLGFREIGQVTFADGSALVMLNLPGDGEVVTLELVHNPALGEVELGNGFSHIAVQVEDLAATVSHLQSSGVPCGPIEHPGPVVCNLRDPDGYRIELVEWPPGHPDEMTSADFRPPAA